MLTHEVTLAVHCVHMLQFAQEAQRVELQTEHKLAAVENISTTEHSELGRHPFFTDISAPRTSRTTDVKQTSCQDIYL